MGYTHYWDTAAKKPTDENVKIMREALAAMMKLSPNTIEINWDKSGSIGFNGIGDNAHETMVIDFTGDGAWNFCKTARKPYDKIVVACLILMKELDIIEKWSSDGDEDDFVEGKEFLKKVIESIDKEPVGV